MGKNVGVLIERHRRELRSAFPTATNLYLGTLVIREQIPEEWNYSEVSFEGENFWGADLRGLKFHRCNFQGADFEGANLCYTDFTEANLKGTNFTSANMIHAILRGASLIEAVLDYTNLCTADLSYANLKSASLDGANLAYADLLDADFELASLDGATFSNNYLHQAKNLNSTKGTMSISLNNVELYKGPGLGSILERASFSGDHAGRLKAMLTTVY